MQLQLFPQYFSTWHSIEKLKPVSESAYIGLSNGTTNCYKVFIILAKYDVKTFSHFRSRTCMVVLLTYNSDVDHIVPDKLIL